MKETSTEALPKLGKMISHFVQEWGFFQVSSLKSLEDVEENGVRRKQIVEDGRREKFQLRQRVFCSVVRVKRASGLVSPGSF